MCAQYKLPKKPKILDVGCGKGYLLYDFKKVIPNAEVYGLDISKYALANSKEEIKKNLTLGSATNLPWPDNYFDLVISINTIHCLHINDLTRSIQEIQRVGKSNKYICVESFRNESKRQIYYIGKSHVKHFIIQNLGDGYLKQMDILEIIHLFTSNRN